MTEPRNKPDFVEEMTFSKPWRPYQARILRQASRAFRGSQSSPRLRTGVREDRRRSRGSPSDRIAHPGLRPDHRDSGTVDRPARSPTSSTTKDPHWLSRDLRKPGRPHPEHLPVAQFAEFRKEGGVEAVVSALKEARSRHPRRRRGPPSPGELVEVPHHLLKESLDHVSVIALTATPPIDVPAAEWNRYASFCGPVDLEVGVPELVAAGNLCPHQDFRTLQHSLRGRRRRAGALLHAGVSQLRSRPANRYRTGRGLSGFNSPRLLDRGKRRCRIPQAATKPSSSPFRHLPATDRRLHPPVKFARPFSSREKNCLPNCPSNGPRFSSRESSSNFRERIEGTSRNRSEIAGETLVELEGPSYETSERSKRAGSFSGETRKTKNCSGIPLPSWSVSARSSITNSMPRVFS